MTPPVSNPPRRYPRARVSVDADVSVDQGGTTTRMDGHLVVLGAGGAFLELGEAYAIGSLLRLRFTTAEIGEIASLAIVRNGLEGKGVGVEFLDIEPYDRERIKAFVDTHAGTPPAST